MGHRALESQVGKLGLILREMGAIQGHRQGRNMVGQAPRFMGKVERTTDTDQNVSAMGEMSLGEMGWEKTTADVSFFRSLHEHPCDGP